MENKTKATTKKCFFSFSFFLFSTEKAPEAEPEAGKADQQQQKQKQTPPPTDKPYLVLRVLSVQHLIKRLGSPTAKKSDRPTIFLLSDGVFTAQHGPNLPSPSPLLGLIDNGSAMTSSRIRPGWFGCRVRSHRGRSGTVSSPPQTFTVLFRLVFNTRITRVIVAGRVITCARVGTRIRRPAGCCAGTGGSRFGSFS